LDRVYKTVAKALEISATNLNEKSGPATISVWDSLGMLNIVTAVEEEFELTLDLDEILEINCVEDIINIVNNKSDNIIKNDVRDEDELDLSSFRKPEKLYTGIGAFREVKKYINSKTIIIIGSGKYANGIYNLLKPLVEDLNVNLDNIVFNKENGEPTLKNIKTLISSIKVEPDTIIGIGGGSVLDTIKLVYISLTNPSNTMQDWLKPFSLQTPKNKIKLISIPTTHGTGAEVSSSTVFSNTNEGKTVILSHQFISDVVIHDPKLLKDIPIKIAIDSTLDAFTHSIEGYLSRIKNDKIYSLVVESLSIIKDCLRDNECFSGEEAKGKLLYASYLAGVIQNHCSVGLCHSLSHQLSRFGIAHGRLNGIFLPKVLAYNYSRDSLPLDKLAIDIGFDDGAEIISWLSKINERYEIGDLSENLELSKISDLSSLCKDIKSDITYDATPHKISDSDLIELINSVIRV
jgi:alcohol dehydrogenase class IV/acyl carrier protein